MSLLNSRIAKRSINFAIFLTVSVVHVSVKAWDIDFSRRSKDLQRHRQPASVTESPNDPVPTQIVGSLFTKIVPSQDIVILNTENGFVPATVRVKKGQNYKVHIVNVNEKEKNVSFILDAFSEHHATYFGQAKSFALSPKVDGIFSYQCPETAKTGQIIIYTDDERKPASE